MNWSAGIRSFFAGWKLLLFVLISLLLLFLTSLQGYVVGKRSTQTIEGQYDKILAENIDSISVNLSNYLNYIDDFARTLSNDPALIAILRDGAPDAKLRAENELKAFSEYYHLRLPVNIQLFDASGGVYAYPAINAWEERRLADAVSGFSWYERRVALDNNFLHWNVAFDFHDASSSNVLYVSKNVTQSADSLGLLVMELNGSLIERMLDRAQISQENRLAIFSPDLATLFASDGLTAAEASELGSVYRSVKARSRDSGSIDVRLQGKSYRALYEQIASTPWTLVSLVPPGQLRADSVNIWRMTAVLTGLSMLFIALFFAVLHLKVTMPVRRLSRIVNVSGDGSIPSEAEAYEYRGFREIETLNDGIHRFLEQIREQVRTIRRGEGEKRELELRMLQEQMRPHFWHNSLNSLRFLAVLHGDPTMAEAILSLTRMLDYTLRNTDVRYSTVEEEKDYALSYARFQEIRSMRQYRIGLELAPEALAALVPKFTLQPLLENAIQHGFSAAPSGREPFVRIAAAVTDGRLMLSIRDNGQGMEEAALRRIFDERGSGRGHGLTLINLRQRIRLEYGEPYGVEVASVRGEFTEVTVDLPYRTINERKEGIAP